MFENDNEPKKRTSFILGQSLDELSVEELDKTVKSLHEEINRLKVARIAKSKHLSAADALFSKNESKLVK